MVDDVDILLFDEPLANLDPATGKQAIELIDEIQKKTGATPEGHETALSAMRTCQIDVV